MNMREPDWAYVARSLVRVQVHPRPVTFDQMSGDRQCDCRSDGVHI
ncbi:hypothetical protein [Nonomuraea jabiensis]